MTATRLACEKAMCAFKNTRMADRARSRGSVCESCAQANGFVSSIKTNREGLSSVFHFLKFIF